MWAVFGAILLGAVAVWTVRWLRQHYVLARVTSDSMAPTFKPGDRVLVRRVGADRLRIGDVVMLARPTPGDGNLVLKRVLALPGDPVPRERCRALRDVDHDVVPPDRLVVIGDAGERSQDSKQLGYFRMADVVGLVPRALRRPPE